MEKNIDKTHLINKLLNKASLEDQEKIVELFESASYNADAFLRTNYLEVIKDKSL